MRRWGWVFVWVAVWAVNSWAADVPFKMYAEANQLVSDGLTLEHRQVREQASAKYLQARKIYIRILNEYPTWQSDSQLVKGKLTQLDNRLRPLLLTQGISPASMLTDPYPKPKVETPLLSGTSPPALAEKAVPLPGTPAFESLSLDEQIAALKKLQASGHKTIPTLTPKSPLETDTTKVEAGIHQTPNTSKPTDLTPSEELARLHVERQNAEQDLQRERFAWQQKEREYQARLREALAARPKALEPGEMAKQMSANRQLRTDFEFLKVASKRGESELLQALDNLENARRENEALLKQYRALQAENARLRRVISGGR